MVGLNIFLPVKLEKVSYLEDGLPGIGYVVEQMGPPFMSAMKEFDHLERVPELNP